MSSAFHRIAWGIAAMASTLPGAAIAQERLLDEVRIGLSGSIQSGKTFEPGVFPSATVFFDPFGQRHAGSFLEHMLRPRLHVGAIVSTAGEASQAYVGFTWTANITDRFFLDLSFGGAVNNGNIDRRNDGPRLGSHVLFREQLAAGVKLDENWRILATVEHSSNANLADYNDGLSYAGISLGYKF